MLSGREPTNRTWRTDRRTVLKTGVALASGALATGNAAADPESRQVHEGESATVGEGTATAYATTDSSDDLAAVGVHLDGDALASVDTDESKPHQDVAAHPSFPDAVDTRQFTFVGFHFNAVGHTPPEIYTVPHFDFHFYTMAEEAVESIPLGLADYEVPNAQFPPGYIHENPRLIVPDMGEHLLDGTAPEFNGREFSHTYVYGSYDPSVDPENPQRSHGDGRERPDSGGTGLDEGRRWAWRRRVRSRPKTVVRRSTS